jgi:hypothetical protein
MNKINLTRRDFFKLTTAGALGFALAEMRFDETIAAASVPSQGRMTLSGIKLYDAPAFNAKAIHVFGKDEVANITAIVDGDEGNPYNKAWYQIEGGYTYSGWIQPVQTNYQKPIFDVPAGGQVGEIVIPLVDAKQYPYFYAKKSYRLYYGSAHWVRGIVVTPEEKTTWYEVYDTHEQRVYYVPTHAMRLVPYEELSALSTNIPAADKLIVVDTAIQLVTAFEGQNMVLSQRCSSGAKGTKTPLGDFLTYHKGPAIHMTNEGDAEANVYDLPGVPWCSFFTGIGNAFHGTYWHNDYGRPRSHGCVNLPSDVAKFIYCWTAPTVPPYTDYIHLPGEGTRVQVISSNS